MIKYNEDSLEVAKGKLAEDIILDLLRDNFPFVHDQRGKCAYDFYYRDADGRFHYADAKCRCLDPARYGKLNSFAFKEEKLRDYETISLEKGWLFELWVLDVYSGIVFASDLRNLRKPFKEFPFTEINHNGTLMTRFSPAQFKISFKIDSDDKRLAALRVLYAINEIAHIKQDNSLVRQDQVATPVDLLTAPNGIDIDILEVNGSSMRFVKAARLYSAFTGLNAGINLNHPIIRAANAIKANFYRFPISRLSGGENYGHKAFLFCLDDVPKILGQYVELNYKSKDTKQLRYNQAAKELRNWFRNEVIPKYARIRLEAQS